MRRTNLISALWKSFYSQELYRDVRENWGFATIVYLLLVVFIYGGIVAYTDKSSAYQLIKTIVETYAPQVPTGQIALGTMSIQEQSPYFITFPIKAQDKSNHAIAVFDMTNSILPYQTTAQLIFHSDGYYFTSEDTQKKASVIKRAQSQRLSVDQRSFNFKHYPKATIHFSNNAIQGIMHNLKIFLPVILIPAMALFYFVGFLIQSIAYAFLVLIFAACYKVRLTYGQSYRLSIIALTPPFFIVAIPHLFLIIKHLGWISFIIHIGYLFFAAYSNRLPRNESKI